MFVTMCGLSTSDSAQKSCFPSCWSREHFRLDEIHLHSVTYMRKIWVTGDGRSVSFALFFSLFNTRWLSSERNDTTVTCIYIEVYLVPYTQRFMSSPMTEWHTAHARFGAQYKPLQECCKTRQLEMLKMIMGLSYMKHHGYYVERQHINLNF
jgi:hypothetical protein